MRDMQIYLLLPDGVGVRNFIYTNFIYVRPKNVNVAVWTDPVLAKLLQDDGISLPVVQLPRFQTTPRIEVLRKAKQTAELLRNARKFDNPVYKTYLPRSNWKQPKQWIKRAWEIALLVNNCNDRGVQRLKRWYLDAVRKTSYYRLCKQQLAVRPPDLVFCTHQRASIALAPLLAAQDLGIPTATFIYSWDNLPKATLAVPADHYVVWSTYMQKEMEKYYPEIPQACVHVAGTPQFVPYFDKSLLMIREEFCTRYGLNSGDRFICFSGDDVTTSPYDPLYLRDLAEAVHQLNNKMPDSYKYKIIFRRCPADWSDRFDKVLARYTDIIHVLDPIWKSLKGNSAWNHFIPDRLDVQLLVNTVAHCEMVVNVGSTMAIDFATMGKPACYIRYDAVKKGHWSVKKIYDFIHFQTMKGLDPVYWIDSASDWEQALLRLTEDTEAKVADARRWQAIIAQHPLDKANYRIWDILSKLIGQHAHLLPERRVSAS